MDGGEQVSGEAPDAAAMAAQAWRRVGAAIAAGRLREAQGWTRLWRELTAMARAEPRALAERASAALRTVVDESCDAARAVASAVRPLAEAFVGEARDCADVHSVHSVHRVSDAQSAEQGARPLTRAERRRRERLAAQRRPLPARDGP